MFNTKKRFVLISFLFLLVIFISACQVSNGDETQQSPNRLASIFGATDEIPVGKNPKPSVTYTLADLPAPFVINGNYNRDVAIMTGEEDFRLNDSTISAVKNYFYSYAYNELSPALPNIKDTADLTIYENLILIGSPCYNRKVAEYMELSYPACGSASSIPEDSGIIKILKSDGKWILIITADERNDYVSLLNYGVSILDNLNGQTYIYTLYPPLQIQFGVITSPTTIVGDTAVEKCNNFGFDGCVNVEILETIMTYPNNPFCTDKADYVDKVTYVKSCDYPINGGSGGCSVYNGTSFSFGVQPVSVTCYNRQK